MKIYYMLNENKEIIRDDFEPFDKHCLSMDRENYIIANGYNGATFLASYMETEEYQQKASAFLGEQKVKALRQRREEECFPVVNRGTLWYEQLTDEQKSELSEWYQAWLDVTDTMEAPDPPEWLA